MWMRLIRSHGLTAGRMGAVVDSYQREDLPRIEQARGFLGIALGENRQGGSIGTVTFWEDEQAMLDTERLSAAARDRALAMFEVEDPMLLDHFEVTYSDSLDAVAGSTGRPFMRVVRFTGLTADTVQDAAGSYREDTERHLSTTRGIFRAAIGINRDAGSLVVVSFWVSERDMRDAARLSEQVRDNARSAATARRIPRVDHFEITLTNGFDQFAAPAQQPVPSQTDLAPQPAPGESEPQQDPIPSLTVIARSVDELEPASGRGVFARITRHPGLTADRVAKTASDIEHTQLPAMQAEPGFAGALILADHIGGQSIGITLWDSEAAMDASESAAARAREAIQGGLAENQRPIVLRCELVGSRSWTFDPAAKPYARLHRHPGLTPERLTPRVEELEQQRIPAIEIEPGFAGAMIFTSLSETQLLGVTLWDNHEAMRRSEAASRNIRAAIDANAPEGEKVTVAHAEIVASRHWAGDRVTALHSATSVT